MSKQLLSLLALAASSPALAHPDHMNPGHVHAESFLSIAIALAVGATVLAIVAIKRWRTTKS